MADVGTLEHWIENRDLYLTRVQAAERIRKSRRTIERYVRAGLQIHEPLPGIERVYVDELLAMWRSKLTAQRSSRFRESDE